MTKDTGRQPRTLFQSANYFAVSRPIFTKSGIIIKIVIIRGLKIFFDSYFWLIGKQRLSGAHSTAQEKGPKMIRKREVFLENPCYKMDFQPKTGFKCAKGLSKAAMNKVFSISLREDVFPIIWIIMYICTLTTHICDNRGGK